MKIKYYIRYLNYYIRLNRHVIKNIYLCITQKYKVLRFKLDVLTVWLINPSLYNDVQMILTLFGTRRGFHAKILAYNYLLAQKDAAVLALCPLRSLVSFSDPRRPRSICTSYTSQSFNYINAAYRYGAMQTIRRAINNN